MLRIPVDFNTMMADEKERVFINAITQKELVDRLRPEMQVMLYDETLEVAAVVEYDEEHRSWWGKPDWSTSCDLPYPSTG